MWLNSSASAANSSRPSTLTGKEKSPLPEAPGGLEKCAQASLQTARGED
jgi:hypothetical protein